MSVIYLVFPSSSRELWEMEETERERETIEVVVRANISSLSLSYLLGFLFLVACACMDFSSIALTDVISSDLFVFIWFAVAVWWRSLVTDCIVECFFIEVIFVFRMICDFYGTNSPVAYYWNIRFLYSLNDLPLRWFSRNSISKFGPNQFKRY